ncbi:uncharacterized protein KD926_006451 [Aspergillus affinis]|uniref:uncharacterized protein n=1 Tax=Aspergillus affinis TaxID=1070780 RepID=UPI0022FE588D|nr:uncharacterized protein KD926_006451 [Aspergillus affinis]KAI9041727.1 hypothetical protein KD926_006451 [Aspergillus affinis]
MVNFSRSWLTSGLLLSFAAQPILGLELVEIEAPSADIAARAEKLPYAGFDRMGSDSLYWGASADGKSSLAKLTLDAGDEKVSIINIEKFRNKLHTVNCTQTTLSVDYTDPQSFAHSQEAWNWINEEDDRTLIVIAGREHCGWNKNRMPFEVSKIFFDKNTQTAKLTGKASTWETVLKNYELTVGNWNTGATGNGNEKRDYDKDFSIDFNHDIDFSKEIPIPDTDMHITLGCDECKSRGSFDFGFHIETKWMIPKSASVNLKPSGVGLDIRPSIGIGGNFTKEIGDEFDVATIPIGGISIKGILEIGPQIVFSVGYSIGEVAGEATISAGVSLDIDDSATLDIDISGADVTSDGWTPTVSPLPLKVDAQIEATAEVYAKASAQIAVEVLGKGWEAGIDLKPSVSATLTLAESSDGVCSDDDDKHIFGVTFAPSAGVSLEATLAKADDKQNPIAEATIAEYNADIDEKCFPFGPKAADETTTSAAPTTTTAAATSSTQVISTSTQVASSSAVTSSAAVPPSSTAVPPTTTSVVNTTPVATPSPSSSAAAPLLYLRDHQRRHRRHGAHF